MPAFSRIDRMSVRVNMHPGTEENVGADTDGTSVKQYAIEIEENILTGINIVTVITVEWRLNTDIGRTIW
jgi:hypothetical protein